MRAVHSCLRALAIAAVPMAFVACGGDDEATPPNTGESENRINWTSDPFEVPTGESFRCFYTDIVTDREISVISAIAKQGEGGHHVSLYYIDNPRQASSEPCSGTTEMLDWHFVVAGGAEGNQLGGDVPALADGLAMRVPEGKQLMVQAHYINTSGKAETQTDNLQVNLTDPAKVAAYAADFVVLIEQFQVQPHSQLEVTQTCVVPDDLNLAMLNGHMHEQGEHFTLESVDEDGNVLETYYDESWQPAYSSHPPSLRWTMEEPFVLTKGTRLRQTCKWNNTTDKKLLFPTEMCVGFAYYFPGESRVLCEMEK